MNGFLTKVNEFSTKKQINYQLQWIKSGWILRNFEYCSNHHTIPKLMIYSAIETITMHRTSIFLKEL